MKRLLQFILLVFALPHFGHAQDSLNLSLLQLPDVERHIFTVSPTVTGQFSELNGSDLSIPLSISLNGFRNHRYKQTFYDINVRNTFNYLNSNSADTVLHLLSNSSNSISSFSRFWYNDKYRFITVNASANFNHLAQNIKTVSYTMVNARYDAQASVGLGLGKGRIDPIDWGHRLGFLLKAFEANGSLSRNLSTDEAVELGRMMAKMDRTRFLDNRYYNIERIEKIDSFFSEKKVTVNAPAFYTALYDQYFFAPQINRMNGKRKMIGFNVPMNFYWRLSKIKSPFYQETLNESSGRVNVYARRITETPVTLHIQRSTSAGINYSRLLGQTDRPNWVELDYSYGYSYYPSTRTRFTNSVSVIAGLNIENPDALYSSLSLNSAFYYYLSPAFRFFGDASVRTSQVGVSNFSLPSVDFSTGVLYNIW